MKILKEMGYEVHTATNMNESEWLKDDGNLDYLDLHKHQIDFGRSPFSAQNIVAYKQLKKLMSTEKFDLMHCHTPVASAIARLAARKYRNAGLKVIYTSHGFHFHKKSSVKDWLIYYPIEYVMAFFTDMVITINKEDYRVIQKFPVKEKRYIPGVGVDVKSIASMDVDKNETRAKYNIPADAFLILSIGELSDRKNHEVIIRAVAKCKENNIYYVICGAGGKKEYLKNLASSLGIEDKVVLAGQCSHDEVLKLCHSCDLGALPSKIEGLGLAGIEMLAAGKPLIASNIHGIVDYAIDGYNSFVCSPDDVHAFAMAINKFYEDKDTYELLSENAALSVKKFSVEKSYEKMSEIYLQILQTSK
jgi:glycosyltransferase involved in cell wall biosynthesis